MAVGPVSTSDMRALQQIPSAVTPLETQNQSNAAIYSGADVDVDVVRVVSEGRAAAAMYEKKVATAQFVAESELLELLRSPEALQLPGGKARLEAQLQNGDGAFQSGVREVTSSRDMVGLVLRAVEERPFLADWLGDVFTPESLVGASMVSAGTSGAAARKWFEQAQRKIGITEKLEGGVS